MQCLSRTHLLRRQLDQIVRGEEWRVELTPPRDHLVSMIIVSLLSFRLALSLECHHSLSLPPSLPPLSPSFLPSLPPLSPSFPSSLPSLPSSFPSSSCSLLCHSLSLVQLSHSQLPCTSSWLLWQQLMKGAHSIPNKYLNTSLTSEIKAWLVAAV